MFRQTVLKTRLANQVVSSAKNSLNHSIRFNSVAIERTPSQQQQQQGGIFSKTIHKVADLQRDPALSQQQQQQQGGKHNNNRNNHINGYKVNPASPWYKQLSALHDCLSHIVDLNDPAAQPFFWDTLRRAMVLYEDLKGSPDLSAGMVSMLIYALHTGLRANRNQLTRLAKKPDYDARSFHTEMNEFIKTSLREVTNDILNNTVIINESGAMHLLTSLKELKLDNEAIAIWASSMENQNLKQVFLKPKVVGVLLPIMYQSGSKFIDLENLYLESKQLRSETHPHLISGMIKTCLAANENQKALDLFDELCNHRDHDTFSALIDVHLAFIGECKDVSIANTFFQKAINREMPYKFVLHVNSVKQFIQNIWNLNEDFNQVLQVWEQATVFYGRNIHHGISSSLNNTFFEIFFQEFAMNRNEGLLKLKEIISLYNDIKPIDEPFFNIIISKCTVWKDKQTIDSLYNAYSLYNIKKSQVSRRIYLKSMGSIDVSPQEILKAWYELIQLNDDQGYDYIANADWAALRDATFASHEDRAELYAKILKKYQFFCRDSRQFGKLHSIVNLYPVLKPFLSNLSQLDDSMVQVPQFKSLRYHNF